MQTEPSDIHTARDVVLNAQDYNCLTPLREWAWGALLAQRGHAFRPENLPVIAGRIGRIGNAPAPAPEPPLARTLAAMQMPCRARIRARAAELGIGPTGGDAA